MSDSLDSMEQTLKGLIAQRDALQQAIDPLQRQIFALSARIAEQEEAIHARARAAAGREQPAETRPAPNPVSVASAVMPGEFPLKDDQGNAFTLGTAALIDGNFQVFVNGKPDGVAAALETLKGECYATNNAGRRFVYRGGWTET